MKLQDMVCGENRNQKLYFFYILGATVTESEIIQ